MYLGDSALGAASHERSLSGRGDTAARKTGTSPWGLLVRAGDGARNLDGVAARRARRIIGRDGREGAAIWRCAVRGRSRVYRCRVDFIGGLCDRCRKRRGGRYGQDGESLTMHGVEWLRNYLIYNQTDVMLDELG